MNKYTIVISILLPLMSYWIYRLKKELNFRREAEKKRLNDASHLNDVQKNTLIGHWEVLANGTTHWSEDMYQLLKLSPKVNSISESFSTIINTADFSNFEASIEQSFSTGKDLYIQCRIIRPNDNQERWIDCRGKVALNNNGTPYKISGYIQDITKQKLSVKLLRASEDKYQAMFKTAFIGMALNDKDGTLLEVNQAYLDIIGYTNEEALKLTYWDLTPKCYQAQEEIQLKSLKDLGHYGPFEKEYIHKDGHRVPVILNGVTIKGSDNEHYTWSCIHNITDRKKAESREKSRSYILELITSNEVLPVILDTIVRAVETENHDMLCSILLLDDSGKYLLSGAAPNLPDFYNEAIHGLEIGLSVGSCGTAAFTNKRVIVEDIQTHPYWIPYKKLASKAGLSACWSEPIQSTQGKVLGTFAIYHNEINYPTAANISLIEQTVSLASIAIEKTQANLALEASDEQMQLVLAGANLGSWDWNINTGEVQRNERWATMLGYTYKEIEFTAKQWSDFIHPQDRDRAWESINDVLEGRSKSHNLEYRMLTKQGGYRWIHDQANVMKRNADGKALRMSGTHSDITDRKISEGKLKLAASVFTHARESIVITDIKGKIIDINDTFTSTTGYSREEAIGQNPRILQSGFQTPEFYKAMWLILLEEGYWSGEIWNQRKNGEKFVEIKTISAVRDENGVTTHYVALGNDITPIKEHQEQLEHIAHYDVLTNLPNRVLLADRLQQAMLHCQRNNNLLAVAFLDLDGFKSVNDTYGHDMGDKLLVALSVRMKKALREGDNLARIGGDEFVAVLTNLTLVEDCKPILERFLLAASEPVTVDNIVLNVSASIGVTIYPQDNVDADQLMRHADQAMYVAKESGKNRYHLFDTAHDDEVKIQRESLNAIRYALDNEQFELYYQPKVNMKTGKITGFEALIRWQHPKRGLLNPIAFLPLIENSPMMIEIGEWVISTALTQIRQWQVTALNTPFNISVNIAAVQLQQPNFTDRLTALLAKNPIVEPRYLTLEVLETSALEDIQRISATMNACMALGVNFALDDFGTGYSSLTYLRRLPADIIKIDQSFVRDMLIDPDDLAIVEGVIALAKSFKRDVIAEGVETIEHGVALLHLGCELAQGYGIAKPMPASDITKWCNNWKADISWHI